MIFVYPNLRAPVAVKNFHNASQASFHWAPNGSALVFHAQTDQSKSNYYGDSHIYLLTSDGKRAEKMRPAKEGAVFDVAWGASVWAAALHVCRGGFRVL